jgi:hypothetical protein
MVRYYRTPRGQFYKQYGSGQCRRVARLEYFQNAGAEQVATAAASAPSVKYSKAEQQCIDWAQERIAFNKANNLDKFKMKDKKGKEFNNIGWLVKTSYEEALKEHPDCGPFFDQERTRKTAAKDARRASKKKRRSRSRKRPRKRSKSRSKKSPRKSPKTSPKKSKSKK